MNECGSCMNVDNARFIFFVQLVPMLKKGYSIPAGKVAQYRLSGGWTAFDQPPMLNLTQIFEMNDWNWSDGVTE